MVAFSAYLFGSKVLAGNERVVFETVLTNEGNAYNQVSGKINTVNTMIGI